MRGEEEMIPLQFNKYDLKEKNLIKKNFCKPIYESMQKCKRNILNDWVKNNIPIKIFEDNSSLNQKYYKDM